MDTIILSTFADLLINLSAGWFGAAVIVPLFAKRPKFRIWALILNLFFGIFALLAAIFFRSLI